MQNKKIILIERSNIIQKLISSELKKQKAIVKTFEDSSAALMEIINNKPDLIITSVSVGNISGFDLCKILKLIPDDDSIPVIIISSSSKDDIKRNMSDVGADYYVYKNKNLVKDICELSNKLFTSEKGLDFFHQKSPVNKSGKILLVDDSAIMRKIVRNILNSISIKNICEAENGKEALKLVNKEKISIILTDWNMPEMNGLELVKEIRKQKKYNSIPIFMVTTESLKEDIAKAKKAGVNDFIIKPFTKEKIKEIISSCLL